MQAFSRYKRKPLILHEHLIPDNFNFLQLRGAGAARQISVNIDWSFNGRLDGLYGLLVFYVLPTAQRTLVNAFEVLQT